MMAWEDSIFAGIWTISLEDARLCRLEKERGL